MRELTETIEPSWLACGADDLVWARLDDDFAVYHRPSGKTHLLNSASAVLLADVLRRPETAAAAAAKLANRERAEVDEAFLATVTDALAHLEHVGLVKRA